MLSGVSTVLFADCYKYIMNIYPKINKSQEDLQYIIIC